VSYFDLIRIFRNDFDGILFCVCSAGGVPARSYFVTHWETLTVKEITFTDDMSLAKFLFYIGISFNLLGNVRSRLYAMYPGMTHEQRIHLKTKDELLQALLYIDEHQHDMDAMQVLYIFPKSESPVASPGSGPLPPPPLKSDQRSDSSNSHSESSKSERSTYQKRFAKEVKERDERCKIMLTILQNSL
jgi:hypothetical protein